MNRLPQLCSRMRALLKGSGTFLFIVGFPIFIHAAAGTQAAAFLNIPVGAGPAALGGAYTALAADAYAPVWNPAGSAATQGTQYSAQHLAYLESMHYEFGSFSRRIGKRHGIGAAIQYLGSGDIEGTAPGGASNGEFSAYYAAYSLNYAYRMTEALQLGLTGKAIQSKLDDVSATAFAGDAGALWSPNPKWRLGATMVNAGSRLKFIDEGDALPLAFRLGAAWSPSSRWTASVDGALPVEADPSAHVGVAWRPVAMLSLRAGYRTDTVKENTTLAGFSTGVGIDLWGQEFSYAWVPYGDLGNTQYFSMLLRFDATHGERRNLIRFHQIKGHRTVYSNEKSREVGTDPDYQQLMQLLSDVDREIIVNAPPLIERSLQP